MLQTRKCLQTHLPTVITDVVITYLQSIKRNWKHIAHAEEYETLMSCPKEELNNALYGATRSGNWHLIALLQTMGKTNDYSGLCGACRGGHLDLVQYFYAREDIYELSMYDAARGNHEHVIAFFESKEYFDWNQVLCGASRGGHLGLFQKAICGGARKWNEAMEDAARGGHLLFVQLCLVASAQNVGDAIYAAIDWRQDHVVDYLQHAHLLTKKQLILDIFKPHIENLLSK